MLMQDTFTTTITDENEADMEIELELDLGPAEPDVGIHGPFIDNWSVTAVNGDTSTERCLEIEQYILDEYGDEKFVEKLYDEGAAK